MKMKREIGIVEKIKLKIEIKKGKAMFKLKSLVLTRYKEEK